MLNLATGNGIDILIIAYNAYDYLLECYLRLQRSLRGHKARIFILENASTDPRVRKFLIKLRAPNLYLSSTEKNVGFTQGVNKLLNMLHDSYFYPYLLMLNPDTLIETDNWVEHALTYMKSNFKCGVLGGLMLKTNNLCVQSLGGLLCPDATPDNTFSGQHCFENWLVTDQRVPSVNPCAYVPFSFAVIRAEIFQKIPYLDDKFPHYYSDCAFCLKVKELGYTCAAIKSIKAFHAEGASAA